jgi:hypothetical protein
VLTTIQLVAKPVVGHCTILKGGIIDDLEVVYPGIELFAVFAVFAVFAGGEI